MDNSQVERWLQELNTEDEEVIESEDDEVQSEPDLQALVRESELREYEEERLSESDETSGSDDIPLSQLATGRRGPVYKSTNGTIWNKDVPPATRTRRANERPCRKVVRRNFLYELAINLIKPLLIRRASIETLPRQLKFRIDALLGNTVQEPQESQHDLSSKIGRVGRCALCSRARNRSTKKWCKTCNKWICPDHQAVVCPECYENKENINTV